MIRFGKLTRMVKPFLAEIAGLGGVTQDRYISPKGIYSNPNDEDALVIPLAEGTSQDIIIALQKPVDLGEGDVILTDDKNLIHLKFDGSEITMITNKLSIDAEKVKIRGDVEIKGDIKSTGSVTNNGTSIGSTHTHQQVADGGSGGVPTTPPL